MSMDKQETNVLLIGQSGVGKSSLLNYLFGKKIQETGVGKPVTGKGVYKKYMNMMKVLILIFTILGD